MPTILAALLLRPAVVCGVYSETTRRVFRGIRNLSGFSVPMAWFGRLLDRVDERQIVAVGPQRLASLRARPIHVANEPMTKP